MAESENILTKLHDLLVYLVPQLNQFPRHKQSVLGDRIETKLLDAQKSCLRAYYSRDKRGHLPEANLRPEVGPHLVRLAHGLRHVEQQHTDERQQQQWVPLCEEDSEGGWRHRPPTSTGQSARVHGLPRRPARKPTRRGLFPAPAGRGTKTQCGRGLVAAASAAGKAPVPFLLAAAIWGGMILSPANALAATAQADSPSFTLDTVQRPANIGGSAAANSAVFTVDTRPYLGPFFAGGISDSGSFTLDTRGGGTVGSGGVVAIYPAASYTPGSGLLTMTARIIDPLYGSVTSGTFGWSVEPAGGVTLSAGLGSYNAGAGQWQASTTYGSGLASDAYTVRYSITTDRGRQGTASLSFTVGASGVVVNGTVKDAGYQTPLSGAQVAIFAAGRAGGLWTLVNSQYGGVVPPLATLLTQLTPVKTTITTATDGAFAWTDVPVGNSYVLVVSKGGYQQQCSSSFSVSAAGATVTRDFRLAAAGQTLAALAADVAAVRSQMESLLEANAETMGEVAQQYYADDIYSTDIDWFNLMGSLTSAASGGFEAVPSGAAEVSKEVFKGVAKDVAVELAKTAAKQAMNKIEGWCLANAFPPNKLGYLQSQVHMVYQDRLDQTNAEFQASAGSQPLASGFSQDRFLSFKQDSLEYAARVSDGGSRYLPSPLPQHGAYGFTLGQMADTYMALSAGLAGLNASEHVLSGIQIVGGAVIIGGAAASATGVGASVGVPAMAVAAAAKTAAGFGKDVIFAVKLEHKTLMAVQFTYTAAVGYPRDNGQVTEAFGDFVAFLGQEAAAPYYLHANNRFGASTRVGMKEVLWAVGGLPGLDVARDTATVTIQDQSTVGAGGSTVAARCVGYCVWEPVTIQTLLGSKSVRMQTSSEVCGPTTLPLGGQVQFKLPYRGYSKNFISLFKPHYLTVETVVGPFRVGSVSKPFYVIAPGEIFRPISWSPPLSLTSSDVVAPASGKAGRVGVNDLKSRPKDVTPLVADSLSADTPVLTTSLTAGTNLWALDLRLFAPAEAGVSLLVTDNKRQRLGYSSTNGLTYSELIGFVTDQGQHPISLRLLNPPAGETYTVTVALLTPGPQPVPVSLFSEPEEVSGAIMVALPSRVILDGDRGAVLSVHVNVAEASQQQALTNVSGTLSNLVKWGGTAVLPLSTNTTQNEPDIGAGESGSVSWPVQISGAAERGKYVGTVRLSSAQTADLDVPVVAVVRRATNVVSLFEGTNCLSGVLQTIVTNGGGGYGQTWVHVPKGYYVVHAQMGVAANSTNLLNPTIDVGADGSAEWAFSGRFDLGMVVDNLETAFNNYLVAHSAGSNTVAVPIRLTGNAGESIQLGGLQLYLETIPNELQAVGVLPDRTVRFQLLAQPGYRYTIQASTNLLTWKSLGSVLPTNSVMPFTDAGAPGFRARYYRAVLE